MAHQKYDAARAIRQWPSIRFSPKTDRALVWYERTTVPRDLFPIIKDGELPEKYRHGAQHPRYDGYYLVDVSITGGDDNKWNLALIYRLDLQEVGGDDWEELLADADLATSYPYFGTSRHLDWELVVVNPDNYVKGAYGTPHPTIANALLVSETHRREGPTMVVKRQYREVRNMADANSEQKKYSYSVSYECAKEADASDRYPIVTVALEVKISEFDPVSSVVNPTCPIDGTNALTTNANLDFNSQGLVLSSPPVFKPSDTVRGTLTIIYRKLPGYKATHQRFNPHTGLIESWTVQAVPTGTTASGLDSNGNFSEIEEVNCLYGIERSGIARPFVSRDYYTTRWMTWPAVLEEIEFMDWVTKESAVRVYPRYVWKNQPYRGPTKVRVQQNWYAAKQTLVVPTVLQPLGFHYSCPFFTINMPPCLHPAITCVCDTGNNDPFWGQNYGSARTYEATAQLVWPDSYVFSWEQEPYPGGGYIVTKLTAYKPY